MKNNIALGALLITASELALLLTGMIIKQISADVPLEQIIFFRNFLGLMLLMPWLYKKGINRLHTERISMHILRGVVGVTAMFCMFYAWGNLPLAQAALLKQTSPLFIPVIAYFWLQERIGIKTIVALFIGFLGVALIIDPDSQQSDLNFAIIVAIIGAILAGVAKVSIRKMRNTETPGRIVFYFALIGTVVSIIPAWLAWVELNWLQLAYLAGIALFSTIGQLLLSKAYGLAPAGQLGPYTYTSVAFAALFGWLIWSEVLVINTWIGIFIIVFAGILAITDRR
jgi:drug/metabolite transporter (DMT)-like permease